MVEEGASGVEELCGFSPVWFGFWFSVLGPLIPLLSFPTLFFRRRYVCFVLGCCCGLFSFFFLVGLLGFGVRWVRGGGVPVGYYTTAFIHSSIH